MSKVWRASIPILTLMLMGSLGCDDGGSPSDEVAVGASCVTSLDCDPQNGLQCIDGACMACVAGELGCPCRSGARCEDGSVCGGGNVCVTPSCTLGSSGCACTPSGGCNDPSLHCSNSLCTTKLTACTPGELDCECVGGGCGPGLLCLEGRVCADASGHLGGDCFEDGTCFAGNRCERDTCVACRPGTQGCSCGDADLCGEGLDCLASVCVATVGLANDTPNSFNCFTPCSSDFTDDDGFHPCVEGLMEGCFGGLSCVEGQCLAPTGDLRTCSVDIDCPDFQACLSGFCVSNCESDNECVAGAVCESKVCRKSCSIDEDTCPNDHFCDLGDGVTGVCMQNDTALPVDELPPTAGFLLDKPSLQLTNAKTSGEFTISNDSTTPAEYIIEKHLHRFVNDLDAEVTRELGGASHTIEDDLGVCTPGTLGCGCAGDQQNLCGDLSSGLSLTCTSVTVAGQDQRVCRLPECSTTDALGCVCEGDDCLTYCDAATCPLNWLGVDSGAGVSQKTRNRITIPAGESRTIQISRADGSPHSFWEGNIRIIDARNELSQDIVVTYSERPDGAWRGEIYYFGDFRLNTSALQQWAESNHTQGARNLQNAFLQAWSSFRNGQLELDRFKALVTATQSESWRSPGVRALCPAGAVCYPFLNNDGFLLYTLDPEVEAVPSGVFELPIGINIRGVQGQGQAFQGKVDSASSMHYPGNPAVRLTFDNDPAQCTTNGPSGCLVFVDEFGFESMLGARHQDGNCQGRFESLKVPYLIPGFLDSAELDPATGTFFEESCRDTQGPFTPDSAAKAARNVSLAAANPVADGQIRSRSVELIDGVLMNNELLFIIFRERVRSWIPGSKDLWAYGYMSLTKQNIALESDAFEGQRPAPETDHVSPGLSCDVDLVLEAGVDPNNFNPVNLTEVLLDGVGSTARGEVITPRSDEKVHYLCVETGEFNGGVNANNPNPCPAGSAVRFFTALDSVLSSAEVQGAPCQQSSTCGEQLANWRALRGSDRKLEQEDPYFLCEDETRAFCSENRFDLRRGKRFFSRVPGVKVFPSLPIAIDDAFRFRTRFQNRAGTNLGFTPALCVGNSDIVPYCYDAPAIEEIEKRVDCLFSLFIDQGQDIRQESLDTFTRLKSFLEKNFAFEEILDPVTNTSLSHSGFETLDVELQVMLGDEAYTKALSSRFDLAGLSIASFPGSELEPGGIDLSGVAGAEMFQLYLAHQYYERALGRFFRLLEPIQRSLDAGPGFQVIGQATVATYIAKLIRASAQKARVSSEIAARYQNFSRLELARSVIERAYVAAYLESLIFTHLMQNIVETSAPEDVAQVAKEIQTAQITYRVAMTDMRLRFAAISEDIDFFGFPVDFMPFPALEAQVGRDTGFEVATNRAFQRIAIAQAAEDLAISTTRTFDTEAASFQNELTRVENSYEAQLVELCGSFEAEGRIFPAIRKYAHLNEDTRLIADPCGFVGNGNIHTALGEVDIAAARLQQVLKQIENTRKEADIEEARIDATCKTKDAWQDIFLGSREESNRLQTQIDRLSSASNALDRFNGFLQALAQVSKCGGTDCPSSAVNGLTLSLAFGATEAVSIANSVVNNKNQRRIREEQVKEGAIIYDFCDADGTALVQIDADARVKTILLRIDELELEALQAQYQAQLAVAKVEQLSNQARRIESELEEMIQLTINVEAARNNPNFRIYKNDAIINADKTFFSALREVYKATLVFEYHTSQTYAFKEELFLTRMVTRGDFNLQNYLTRLEDEFRLFEDTVGVRDQRLLRLSMRDDILQIPRVNEIGVPYTEKERFDMFRDRLASGALLDENGYITADFSIDFEDVSPLTRNHKITFLESELVGSGVGDQLAKVYVRMSGTSAIRELDGDLRFYTFPIRTAVSNAFVNGSKPFDAPIYRTLRFAERPLINSRWELLLNLVDEPDNEDLGLDGLTDIFLYFYYGDFTNL